MALAAAGIATSLGQVNYSLFLPYHDDICAYHCYEAHTYPNRRPVAYYWRLQRGLCHTAIADEEHTTNPTRRGGRAAGRCNSDTPRCRVLFSFALYATFLALFGERARLALWRRVLTTCRALRGCPNPGLVSQQAPSAAGFATTRFNRW